MNCGGLKMNSEISVKNKRHVRHLRLLHLPAFAIVLLKSQFSLKKTKLTFHKAVGIPPQIPAAFFLLSSGCTLWRARITSHLLKQGGHVALQRREGFYELPWDPEIWKRKLHLRRKRALLSEETVDGHRPRNGKNTDEVPTKVTLFF